MPALKLHNQRCLDVMNYVVGNRINGIKSETDFLRSIGFSSTNNLNKILTGIQGFKFEQIQMICDVYGVDGNYILRSEHKKMLLPNVSTDTVLMLKDATEAIIKELENTRQAIKSQKKKPINTKVNTRAKSIAKPKKAK